MASLCVVRLAKLPSLRWMGLLALSFALSILLGFHPRPRPRSRAFAVAVALIVFQKAPLKLLGYCAIAAVLALLLSAVQLLPTAQVSSLSV